MVGRDKKVGNGPLFPSSVCEVPDIENGPLHAHNVNEMGPDIQFGLAV